MYLYGGMIGNFEVEAFLPICTNVVSRCEEFGLRENRVSNVLDTLLRFSFRKHFTYLVECYRTCGIKKQVPFIAYTMS